MNIEKEYEKYTNAATKLRTGFVNKLLGKLNVNKKRQEAIEGARNELDIEDATLEEINSTIVSTIEKVGK